MIRVTREDFSDEIKVLVDHFNLRKMPSGNLSGTIWLLNKCFFHDCVHSGTHDNFKSSRKNVIMGTTLLYHLLGAVHFTSVVLSAFLPSLSSRCHWPHFIDKETEVCRSKFICPRQRVKCSLTASCTNNECQLLTVYRDKAAGFHLRKEGCAGCQRHFSNPSSVACEP